MHGVKIEAWRNKRGPAKCHRCQKFRHSSHQRHHQLTCLRCGEGHVAKDCSRPREEARTAVAHIRSVTSGAPCFRRKCGTGGRGLSPSRHRYRHAALNHQRTPRSRIMSAIRAHKRTEADHNTFGIFYLPNTYRMKWDGSLLTNGTEGFSQG
ncbi:hypothetical protein PYW08_012623 [Mythimna loreyi]|uniref:Uncharacterized protein n=1 Tax=Mythimna loreyi TaxID=667449 RepID=A0ACC2Q1K1_9NEOP|nr:hypothetical protein PYW08_012623 [Mythimna loreyi]